MMTGLKSTLYFYLGRSICKACRREILWVFGTFAAVSTVWPSEPREERVEFQRKPCYTLSDTVEKRVAKTKDDLYWMGKAIREARKAEARGEVPIGAVIVRDGEILGRGHNLRETSNDPTTHAELIAIRRAAKKAGNWRLSGATLYVTLEPCLMCMGGIILSRLERVVFGCFDPKGGAAGSLYDVSSDTRLNHRVELTSGVLENECSLLLSTFFRDLRQKKRALRESSAA